MLNYHCSQKLKLMEYRLNYIYQHTYDIFIHVNIFVNRNMLLVLKNIEYLYILHFLDSKFTFYCQQKENFTLIWNPNLLISSLVSSSSSFNSLISCQTLCRTSSDSYFWIRPTDMQFCGDQQPSDNIHTCIHAYIHTHVNMYVYIWTWSWNKSVCWRRCGTQT